MTAGIVPVEELTAERPLGASMATPAGQQPSATEDDERQEGSLGYLDEQEWPDEKLAKHLTREWTARDDEMKVRLLRWMVNRLRRQGERWVGIKKHIDRNEWRIYLPPGGVKAPPTLGKAARLCRRITSQMFQDPPTPEAVPASDSDGDRTSAEFASRLLQAIGSEAGVNNVRNARRAYNKSHTYGSAFRHHYVDEYGGGMVPERLMAHPEALSPEQALSRPVQDGATGQVMDQPFPEDQLQMRMLSADGKGFTEDETEAKMQFQPALRQEVLTGAQVRFYPITASAIDEADSAILLCWTTLGQLRSRYEEALEDLGEEKLKQLVEWKPGSLELKYLLPDHITEADVTRSRQQGKDDEEEGNDYPDRAILCYLLVYQKACYDHTDGAVIAVAGGKHILEREEWVAEHDGRREVLDIPIDQVKGYDEGEDDPYGKGTMDFLGSGDELLANIDSSWVTHLERFNNRKTFVPITSAFQEKIGQAAMGTYVPINPGGEPRTEDVPAFPQDSIKLRETVVENLDDESGLQLTAQGVDSPYVQSGFHAVQVIEQVLAGLSEPRQNVADALERGWRIQLQLIRAFFDTPQQTRFLGEDQSYKQEYWMASDLGSTVDVRILRGTFSMMTPAMKSSIAVTMQQAGITTPYELRRFTIGSTGGLVGVEDDPFWMRVQRQIAAWRKGDPQAFVPVPSDTLPEVAPMRLQELARAMAGTDYQRADPATRQAMDQAYIAMVNIVYPPPPPDPNAPPPEQGGTDVLPTEQQTGLPPDAGTVEPPPDAGMPDVGAPQLDGVPLPETKLGQPPDYFNQ